MLNWSVTCIRTERKTSLSSVENGERELGGAGSWIGKYGKVDDRLRHGLDLLKDESTRMAVIPLVR